MGYIEEHDLAADNGNDLHKKVSRAIVKAAAAVVYESKAAANHDKRFVWACRVRLAPENADAEAHRWILLVLDNPSVAGAGNTASDDDVQFVVNGLVDTMAG